MIILYTLDRNLDFSWRNLNCNWRIKADIHKMLIWVCRIFSHDQIQVMRFGHAYLTSDAMPFHSASYLGVHDICILLLVMLTSITWLRWCFARCFHC